MASAAQRRRRQRVLRRQQRIREFDSRFPLKRITYQGRYIKSKGNDIRLNLDVRNFIQYNDNFVYNFAKVAGATTGTIDQRAHRIQQAVCNYITYTSDEINEGYTEFWQFPSETLALRCGDCEDGAILMASAMAAADIPLTKIRIFAGYVKTGNPQQPWGGHGYVVYLRNSDTMPVVLDWCYRADPNIPVTKKPTIYQNTNYGDVWFSFNHQYSWGSSSLRFESRQELENKFIINNN
jgi:hypothetical protein